MPDYKTLYHKLFNKITDVIDALQQVQQEAEDVYLNDESAEIIVLDSK